MEGDIRVISIALFYDLFIFGGSFLTFLYLRRLRGDRRQRGVRVLQRVRSARGPLDQYYHRHQSPIQQRRGSFSAPSTPTGGRHETESDNDDIESDNNDLDERGSQSCRYIGLGGWRVTNGYENEEFPTGSISMPLSMTRQSLNNSMDCEVRVGTTPRMTLFSSKSQQQQSKGSQYSLYSARSLERSDDHIDICKNSRFSSTSQTSTFPKHTEIEIRKHRSSIEPCLYPRDQASSFPPSRSAFASRFNEGHYNPYYARGEKTMWGWLKILCQVEDRRFQSTDVQFYLLFLKTCQAVTFSLSLVALCGILPVNLSTPSTSANEGWLDRASAENITAQDGRIWVLMACTWVYSLVTYFYVHRFWVGICDPVLLWNADSFNPEAYTIMVEGVSRAETQPSILFDHFGRLFPDKVVCTNLILDFSELLVAKKALEDSLRRLFYAETLQSQQQSQGPPSGSPLLTTPTSMQEISNIAEGRDTIVASTRALELSMNKYHIEDDPSVVVPRQINALPSGAASVSLQSRSWASHKSDIRYWRSLVEMKTIAVDNVLAKPPSKNAGVGFVSFRDTNCVIQCLEDPRAIGNHYDWHFSPAPPPQDVLWLNIHISKTQRRVRATTLMSLLVLVSMFLTSSAVLTNALLPLAENVEKAFNEADFLRLSVTGWGAPLILFVVNSLLIPIMVQGTADSIGYWRVSDIDSTVLHGNVIFLVLNTVIFPTIGNGSIGALLAQMYNTQIQKWNISLGKLIVGQSGSFALRYLLNSCFLSSACQLLQLGQLSWFGVLQTFGKDPEQWNFDFGYSYAFCISIFFMVLSFGVVIPLVLPFGCLFFTLKYFVDKYNFLFGIWKVEQESAGAVASIASRYLLAAVAFLQFVMSGYFVAFGLRSSAHEVGAPDMVTVVATGISKERGLVLGGTLLFVVSLVSAVLLIGHSVDVFHVMKTRAHVTSHLTHLSPEQERQLCRSYIHPYEHEIEKNLLSRNGMRDVNNSLL